MGRPICTRSTENQAARIGVIIGVFLDNLATTEGLKHFVNADTTEGFRFHLSTRVFGESASPQT